MRLAIQNPKRAVTSVFIVWTLFAFACQAFPPDSFFHETLNRLIDPYISMTGTWIGSTSFFSPAPPKDQMQVEGRVYFDDGTYRNWITPEVSSLGYVDKFVYNRGIKYFDNLYRDHNAASWPHYAKYLMFALARPDHKEVRVELIRRWRNSPLPSFEHWYGLQPWATETGYPHEYVFFRSPK